MFTGKISRFTYRIKPGLDWYIEDIWFVYDKSEVRKTSFMMCNVKLIVYAVKNNGRKLPFNV